MSEHKFPTEVIDLPSQGKVYPKDSPLSDGKLELKYMTTKEEDILMSQNLIKKGVVIDKLIDSLIVTDGVKQDDLLLGDKNAVLVASRILGYGAEYSFKLPHPKTGEMEVVSVDLTKAEDRYIDESIMIKGKNEFEFNLPTTKINLTFKLLTQEDEKKINNELKGLKKINKKASPELTTRLKYLIQSVNGDYEKKTIREFVDNNLLARDARALREYVRSIQPDIDLEFNIEFEDGHIQENVTIPINASFFWPDAEL